MDYKPDLAGTLLPDGSRWGAYDAAGVTFEGDVDGVFASRKVEVVASGFRWTEGPTWVAPEAALLFSDTIDARVYRWTRQGGPQVWLDASGGFDGTNVEGYDMIFEPGSNGMARSGDDLYICQHATHRVVKAKISEIEAGSRFADNTYEVLAESFEGKPLNSPNDVVVSPVDGSVWFTDPIYGFLQKTAADAFTPVPPLEGSPECNNHNPCDLPYLDERCAAGVGQKGVYRFREGKLELATAAHERPNGLAFGPGGNTLWVANSSKELASWTEYAVSDALPLVPLRTLSELELGSMPGAGVSDGFKVDEDGLIWSSMPAGVCVIDPSPANPHVVAKVIFNTNISNIEFGADGDVWVTGLGHIWRLQRKRIGKRRTINERLLHIVALKFRPDMSKDQIRRHFAEEVRLKERMPELVLNWSFRENLSATDRADVNKGCEWVVVVELANQDALNKYVPHPEHVEVKQIQGGSVKSSVVPELAGKLVVDIYPCDFMYSSG